MVVKFAEDIFITNTLDNIIALISFELYKQGKCANLYFCKTDTCAIGDETYYVIEDYFDSFDELYNMIVAILDTGKNIILHSISATMVTCFYNHTENELPYNEYIEYHIIYGFG